MHRMTFASRLNEALRMPTLHARAQSLATLLPRPLRFLAVALVTTVAQEASYAVFAVLVLTVLARLPQGAIVAGAAVGALISYNGHRLFAFAPSHADAWRPHWWLRS